MYWEDNKNEKRFMINSKLQTMLITFSNTKSVTMIEWGLDSQTVIQKYYKEALIKVDGRSKKKRPE